MEGGRSEEWGCVQELLVGTVMRVHPNLCLTSWGDHTGASCGRSQRSFEWKVSPEVDSRVEGMSHGTHLAEHLHGCLRLC